MTPESKPQGSFLPIGTRIRFTKTLASLASGDHPAFLFAEEGDEGEITGHGTKEGYWAKTSYNPPFGVSRDEFEPIEASKPQGSEQPLNPCQHCDESQVLEFGHSQGQIRVECPCGASGPWCDTFNAAESQWNKVNPLPSPSADEEVEREALFKTLGWTEAEKAGDNTWHLKGYGFALSENVLKQTTGYLQSRAAELQQLRASLAEKEEALQEVSRSKVSGDQLNAKYLEEIEELKAEVKRALRAAGQYRSQLAGD